MSLHIDGPESGQLSKAILSAVDDNVMTLQQVMKHKLNFSLSNVASMYAPLPQVVFEMIGHFNSRWDVDKLVLALLEYNPQNALLLEFAWNKRILQSHRSGVGGGSEPEPLERMLDPVRGFADPLEFLRRFGQITRCVCRISVPSDAGTEYGTGMLIGDSTVLTNYHVMQSLIENKPGADPTQVEFLFDYQTDQDGKTITPGVAFKLANNSPSWLIDSSAYDAADLKVRNVADNVSTDRPLDKLDYAIVRLAGAPGSSPVGEKNESGGKMRGHIPLPADAENRFETDFELTRAAIFVFQHPNMQPLRMDWQKPGILGVNSNRTRVFYDVNTQSGSSGSPCFNSHLDLIALHHAGGKDWPADQKYLYNQGIPISTIYQALAKKNKLSEIK